jgi:hypothetical protein
MSKKKLQKKADSLETALAQFPVLSIILIHLDDF